MNKEITLDEMKSIELNILVFFNEICKKYNLRYSLAYGTLLGAVRHGGFIPWDDDIDVMMPRSDYIMLEKIIVNETENTDYCFLSHDLNEQYLLPLSKLYYKPTLLVQHYGQKEGVEMGVYIDIFVVDGLPEDSQKSASFYKHSIDLRNMWSLATRGILSPSRNIFTKLMRMVVSIPFHFIGVRYFLDRYILFCKKYNFDSSEYAGVVLFGEGIKKEKLEKINFEKYTTIEFEGLYFPVISEYKKYLSNMYSNYMQLPPESERVSKHPHSVYWR